MSTTFNATQAIASVFENHTNAIVRALADKYGFDAVEARGVIGAVDVSKPTLTKDEKKAQSAEKKAKREAKKQAKAGKPKRAATGYITFCVAERITIKSESPEMKPKDVVCELAKRWKALSAEERTEWNERAKTPTASDESDDELDLEENSDETEE